MLASESLLILFIINNLDLIMPIDLIKPINKAGTIFIGDFNRIRFMYKWPVAILVLIITTVMPILTEHK